MYNPDTTVLTTACELVQTTGSLQTPLLCTRACVCVCPRKMKHSYSSKPDTRLANIPLRTALFRNEAAGCTQSHHTAVIKHLLRSLVASGETAIVSTDVLGTLLCPKGQLNKLSFAFEEWK